MAKAQEQNAAHLSNRSDVVFPSPGEVIRNPAGVTVPREVAQTPEAELRYPPHDNDDTLINEGEELDLSKHRENELMQSTSPPGSERTRQVSYNQGRFFDSPAENRFRPINEPQQRRTLLDQQDDRVRVQWSSEGDSQLTERRRSQPAPTSQGPGKRGRDETADDSDDDYNDDSDDAFERPEPKIDKMAHKVQKPQQPPNKRQRRSTEGSSGAADQLQDDLITSSHPQQNQSQPTSTQPASTQVESPQQGWTQTARARIDSIEPSPSQSRWSQANNPVSSASHAVPNMRRRWTADENERLILLIGRHGTSWAEIKLQDDICPRADGGPKLQGRTQVNLKDRARNIKRGYVRYEFRFQFSPNNH